MSVGDPGRAALTAATVVAAVPYLSVKIAWLAGWPLGQRDPAVFAAAPYPQANAATLLLDVAVVGTVWLLAGPGPGRVPPVIAAAVGWLGGGLLGPVLVGVVVLWPAAWAVGAGQASDALHGWVYLVVYASLVGQAVLLQVALAGFLRRRTPRVWAAVGGGGHLVVESTRWLLVAVGVAAAAGLLGFALATGLGAGSATDLLWRSTAALHAAIAAGTALTVVQLMRRRRPPGYARAGVVWFGTAAMTAWGGYDTVLSLWSGAPAALVVWSLLRCVGGVMLAAAALAAVRSHRDEPEVRETLPEEASRG